VGLSAPVQHRRQRSLRLRAGRACTDADRAGEGGRTLNVKDFDWSENLFVREGVEIVHLSGLICRAVARDGAPSCLELARPPENTAPAISFDLNHRASFWKGREEELRGSFWRLPGLRRAGGERGGLPALPGIEGRSGREGLAAKIDAFKGMIGRARQAFPTPRSSPPSLREVMSTNCHLWGATPLGRRRFGTSWSLARSSVLDGNRRRDAFVGGLLYAILRAWEPKKWIQFAWASGRWPRRC